jgi:type III secretory pathway component EscS
MKAILILFVLSPVAGIVVGLAYGATQVSASTWDVAVIILAVGAGVNLGSFGIARIVAAIHAPAEKRLYQIDKAIITDGRQLPPPQF